MICFLLRLCSSKDFTINDWGFHNFTAGSEDTINFGAFNKPAAIYLTWNKEVTNPTIINYVGEDGRNYQVTAALDSGFRIVTKSGSFKMTNRRNVVAWALPIDSCPGISITYSTNHVISESFDVSVNYSSICMFFSTVSDFTTFAAKAVTKENSSLIRIYHKSSVQNTGSMAPDFEGMKFSGNIKEPFFAELINIRPHTTIEMKYDMKNKLDEVTCGSDVLTEYENGQIKFEDLSTTRSDKSCKESLSLHDLTGMTNLIFGSVIIVVSVIIVNESMKAICPHGDAQPKPPELIPDANDEIVVDISTESDAEVKDNDGIEINV